MRSSWRTTAATWKPAAPASGAGLYFTCVNSYLTAAELAYILTNSQSRILITSRAKLDVAREALKECPKVELCIVADGEGESDRIVGLQQATAGLPKTPIADESIGTAMLYSSGTTGRPKGILRPLPEQPPAQQLPLFDFLQKLWHYREGMIYLSPAPLYHSAPQAAVNLTIRDGGTVIIMESFDPERYLELVQKWGITHTQLVPTMFSRMLKLPEDVRSALRPFIARDRDPCRGALPGRGEGRHHQMVGADRPRILRRHRRARLHRLQQRGMARPSRHRRQGAARRPAYSRREHASRARSARRARCGSRPPRRSNISTIPAKTQEARSADGSMSTVGDVGYVDDDGYLYLTDRATFMIISGGVNIYPQECENLLITHPKIADAAVFGVPNPDLGEEVKAVVQPMPGVAPGQDLAEELIAFCSQSLSRQKVPRSIDFEAELPRLPTGKLYKRLLRDRYWGNKTSRIV